MRSNLRGKYRSGKMTRKVGFVCMIILLLLGGFGCRRLQLQLKPPIEEMEDNRGNEDPFQKMIGIEKTPNEENSENEVVEQKKEDDAVVRKFEDGLPDEVVMALEYKKYPMHHHYVLVLAEGANIREKPSADARSLKKATWHERINVLAEVEGEHLKEYGSNGWCHVFWEEEGDTQHGYIFSQLVQVRSFQWDKMYQAIEQLRQAAKTKDIKHISNYKNANGVPPLYHGQKKDKYGTVADQVAPAYVEPNKDAEFRYIEDGTIVYVSEKQEMFYKINSHSFEGKYWVHQKYVSDYPTINEIKKVVVVDRKNQNQAVFEWKDGKWHLISYTLATTGQKAQFKMETPLGYFMAIQTVDRFLYLDDITEEIKGYAPYAIRYNGGSYIHGVPVAFIEDGEEQIDPGEEEYLFSIGTVSLSHRCVRNYTSHAKFLYDWIDIGSSAVIVIE